MKKISKLVVFLAINVSCAAAFGGLVALDSFTAPAVNNNYAEVVKSPSAGSFLAATKQSQPSFTQSGFDVDLMTESKTDSPFFGGVSEPVALTLVGLLLALLGTLRRKVGHG